MLLQHGAQGSHHRSLSTQQRANARPLSSTSSRPCWGSSAPRCSRRCRAAEAAAPVAVEEVSNGALSKTINAAMTGGAHTDVAFDPVSERELLQDNGLGTTRKTKLICTIGPASSSYEMLRTLAENGMNVARLNMTHGDHSWHKSVIDRIKQLNEEKGYCIAIMVDTEGSEIHTGSLNEPIKTEVGSLVYFTIRNPAPATINGAPVIVLSYDSFADDVCVGDTIVVDGGMVELEVVSKAGPDVCARSLEQGLILSAANLTFRRNGELIKGRNSLLPVITAKDWMDIDFAISCGVDFLAISFVRTPDVLQNLRTYIATRTSATIELIAKIEAFDSLTNLDAIIAAADGVMVARGDLGAQIPVEDVPNVQKYVSVRARQSGKPCIVAHQLLQSMIEYPIPTRAEVSDIADVVRQRADGLMLSGESAMGRFPEKALGVLRSVATRVEAWVVREKFGAVVLPQIAETPDGRVSEEVCASAALMANNLGATAIFVYTRRGYMAHFLSRCRPDAPIFAFTDDQEVRQRLNLRWGVSPLRMAFQNDPEDNVQRSFSMLKERGLVREGELVVVVSDLRPRDEDIIRSVQVRRVQ